MLNRSASLAMSTSVLKALPGKLDIKRHSPGILYLAHLSQWLMVSYFDRWMSVVRPLSYVRRQQLPQRTSPPKLLDGF